MTNVLIDQLPTSVRIEDQEFMLDTDFRTCLRVILAFEDPDLAGVEKQLVLLENLYPEVPDQLEEAVEVGLWFLDGGEESRNSEEQKPFDDEKLYSFNKDASFIYSAFRKSHGIDLETVEYLHWWKFLYLFMDLGEETFFIRLISLRKRMADGSATKEERKAAEEMEAVNRFMELLERGSHETKS
jgi:hypothetical protein